MRRIYFVRHGTPDFPGGKRMCIGTTDIPLSNFGKLQAYLAGVELNLHGIGAVFTSPLSRAAQTAELIRPLPKVIPGLAEMHAGIWDGYSFEEIKEKWPELYHDRGINPNTEIPGSEDVHEGQKRFANAVDEALSKSSGDIVIVAHATVIQSFICKAEGCSPKLGRNYSPIPYGSYSVIRADDMKLETLGKLPDVKLSEDVCLGLLNAAAVTDDIRSHCIRVSEKTAEITDALDKAGVRLNKELAVNSALLHDIARTEKCHDMVGAEWLAQLGYPAEAEIVRQHHDISFENLNEAAIVHIADKCIKGVNEVSLETRFSASAEKCLTEEAIAAHGKKYLTACKIRKTIHSVCGREIIQ